MTFILSANLVVSTVAFGSRSPYSLLRRVFSFVYDSQQHYCADRSEYLETAKPLLCKT